MLVVPVRFTVPLVHANPLLIETAPAPASVPPDKVKLLRLEVPSIVKVPADCTMAALLVRLFTALLA